MRFFKEIFKFKFINENNLKKMIKTSQVLLLMLLLLSSLFLSKKISIKIEKNLLYKKNSLNITKPKFIDYNRHFL